MKTKLLGILLILLSLFVACAAPTEEMKEVTSFPIEVTDQAGRVVKLEKVPERIISLAPSNTEILFALGLGDKVVAVTDYCNYPPEAEEKPSIGGFSTPDVERVVSFSPDLVLATSIHQKEVIPALERRGLTTFILEPQTLDEVLESITLVGEVTGREEEASLLVAGMQSRIKAVTDRTDNLPEAERPRVFYLVWHDPLMISGAGTLHHELIQKAGGRNIFPDVTGFKSVDLETLIARDPQVMIAGIGMGTGEDEPLQYLKTESRLQDTEAGKNGRIYGVDMDLTGRDGPRIVDALEQVAKCIHPEIFG